MELRNYTKKELKNLFTNLLRKRITDDMMDILIDTLWREKPNLRSSGFFWPGAPDSLLSWDNATRTLLLEPRPGTGPGSEDYIPFFRFFTTAGKPVLHRHYEYNPADTELPNPDAIELPDEEGLYIILYEANETNRRYELDFIKDPDIDDIFIAYTEKVVVAWVYWDALQGQALYFGDSRHGSEWNKQMLFMLHQTANSQRQEGIGLTGLTIDGDGEDDADFEFGISAGKLWHEDIYAEKEAVAADKAIPVFYREAGGLWRQSEAGTAKFLNTGSGRAAFNSPAGGMAEADDGNFVAYHYFATNCMINSHVAAAGQAQFSTIGEAVSSVAAEVATLKREMPHSNLMYIGSVILQTSDDYTNSTKTRVVWNNDDTDTFVTDVEFNDATRTLIIYQNNNKEPLTVVIPGTPGEDGKDGDDGTSVYTYVAYASDNTGTGFSLTPTNALKYRAEIHVTTELTPPVAADFTGAIWVKYIGDDGSGGGGPGGNYANLNINFDEADTEIIYSVPKKLKYTSQASENTNAVIVPVLNTVLDRYDKLKVTSTAKGLITLYGELID